MENSKKEAALLGVKLSSLLILVAIATGICYTITHSFIKHGNFLANSFYLASYVLLVHSIFNGGKGIDQIRKEGFNDNWKLKYEGENYFNIQALSLILSLLIFGIAILYL